MNDNKITDFLHKLQNDYINLELPYKLNILWSHIHWSRFYWSLNEEKYAILNKGLINCALLESSILFGRLLLEFIGIKHNKHGFVTMSKKYKDDILINDVFPTINLCSTEEVSLLNNRGHILYLLMISSKRVAHNTFNDFGKTEIDRIHSAQELIHQIIEKMLPDISRENLLKYNELANMTT
ncbi:hypothetical protein A8C56_07890 [Niabella ginsenosidivorans]|uniref:Uncharacterized protein n=1 Tax=Niabella ginsenosidivorans TaxID=1176587 RepID=A0A1A9I2K7_9BACT|nr:hypothetical protein [Niabella ginsenosidivorans]ANH80912.1 hypothetical protein A8C56_07890 [Niabella ginsenosidivorans]